MKRDRPLRKSEPTVLDLTVDSGSSGALVEYPEECVRHLEFLKEQRARLAMRFYKRSPKFKQDCEDAAQAMHADLVKEVTNELRAALLPSVHDEVLREQRQEMNRRAACKAPVMSQMTYEEDEPDLDDMVDDWMEGLIAATEKKTEI